MTDVVTTENFPELATTTREVVFAFVFLRGTTNAQLHERRENINMN
jgi:hypothetical protein